MATVVIDAGHGVPTLVLPILGEKKRMIPSALPLLWETYWKKMV